jgi:hypothetical protein
MSAVPRRTRPRNEGHCLPAVLLPQPAPVVAFLAHLLILVRNALEFVIRKVLYIDHLVLRLVDRFDDFIQLEVDRAGVAVLRILDQENDQEGHHGRAGIDDELPGIRVVEVGSRQEPQDDGKEGGEEGPFCAHPVCRPRGKDVKALFTAISIRRHVVTITNSVPARKYGEYD